MQLRNRNITSTSTPVSTTTSSPKKRRHSPRLHKKTDKTEKMTTTKKPTGRRPEHTHHMVLRSHV